LDFFWSDESVKSAEWERVLMTKDKKKGEKDPGDMV
jgi:hypothetical protein